MSPQYPERDFLPTFIPPTSQRNAALLYPGLRIDIRSRRKALAYQKELEIFRQIRNEMLSYNFIHAALAVTGALIPCIARVWIFPRVYGRGRIGIFSNTVISSVAAFYAPLYTNEFYNWQWRQKLHDDRFSRRDREIFFFHRNRSREMRKRVATSANVPLPDRPIKFATRRTTMLARMTCQLYNFYLIINNFGFVDWRRWWYMVWWPENMELAWQEMFLDQDITRDIYSKWNDHLGIQGPSSKPSDPVRISKVTRPAETEKVSSKPVAEPTPKNNPVISRPVPVPVSEATTLVPENPATDSKDASKTETSEKKMEGGTDKAKDEKEEKEIGNNEN